MAETHTRPLNGRMSSVARSRQGGKIEHAPHRQFSRTAPPLGTVSVRADVSRVAERVLAKIKEGRRARSCGSAVYADLKGRVYAVLSESVTADAMRTSHPDWFVCEYAGRLSNGSHAAYPTCDDIAEDLAFHFVQLGRHITEIPEQLDFWGFGQALSDAFRAAIKTGRSKPRASRVPPASVEHRSGTAIKAA